MVRQAADRGVRLTYGDVPGATAFGHRLESDEVSASIEVPVEKARTRDVHASIARSAASIVGAVISAVRLGLIEPPPCRV
jgi:hypothetical protein